MFHFIKKYSTYIYLTVLVIVGYSLALQIIGRDFWYDEAYTGILVRMPWSSFWETVNGDVHPPLYYLAVKFWGMIWSYSDIGIRSFSLFSYMVCIPFVFAIGRHLNEKVAYTGAALFTLSPFFVGYATEARMYMFLCLLILAGVYFFLKFLNSEKSLTYVVGASIMLGLASLTHYFGILACASVFVSLAIIYRRDIRSKEVVQSMLLIFVIPLLMFSVWGSILLQQTGAISGFGWIPATDINRVPESLYIFLYGHVLGVANVPDANSFILFFPAIILFSILLLGLIKAFRNPSKKLVFLGIFSFLPVVVLLCVSFLGGHLYLERYLLPFGVVWCILLVYAVTILYKPTVQKIVFGLYVLSVLVFQVFFLSPADSIVAVSPSLERNREIVSDNPFDYTVLTFYFPHTPVYLYNAKHPDEDFSAWNIIEPDDVLRRLEEHRGAQYLTREIASPENVEFVEKKGSFSVGIVR